MSDHGPKLTPRRPVTHHAEPPPTLDDVARELAEFREEFREFREEYRADHLALTHMLGTLAKEIRSIRKERK